MKKKWLVMVSAAAMIVVAGCGQSTQTNSSSGESQASSSSEMASSKATESTMKVDPKADVNTFVDQYAKANKKVSTVQLESEANVVLFGTTAGGKGKFIFEFNEADQSLAKYYSQSLFGGQQSSVETHFIHVAPNKYYYKNEANQWEAVPADKTDMLMSLGVVDYVELYDSLANVLLKEKGKYEINETHKSYEIVITDRTFDVQAHLAKIMDISLVDVDMAEVEKNITYKVNKETLLFEELDIKLYRESEEGKIDIHTTFTASGWNTVDTSVFKEINE